MISMLYLVTILLFMNIFHYSKSWHVYNVNVTYINDNHKCPSTSYKDATKPYSKEFIERLSLWPNLMSLSDELYGETIYNSKEALEIIHKNQNPEDCLNAKYLISGGWPYGFGSRIHMEGIALGLALHLGRVYMPHPYGDNFFFETQIEFCRQQQQPGLNCFYQLYTKCTLKDALKNSGTWDINQLPTRYMGDFSLSFESRAGRANAINSLGAIKTFNLIQTTGGGKWNGHRYIPYQLRPLIDCSPMRKELDYYWWRAISATYITRPNNNTLEVLKKHMTLPITSYDEVISMFVRHGDKGIEMKLLDFKEFQHVAQYMWNKGLVPASYNYIQYLQKNSNNTNTYTTTIDHKNFNIDYQNQGSIEGNVLSDGVILHPKDLLSYNNIPLNGTMFITTEDWSVIEEATLFGKANNWKIIYTNLFDRKKQIASLDWDTQHQHGINVQYNHDKLEYISMLLNLYYSLRSETFICTLASNSCRIIDELRATIGGKANKFYADLSYETCSAPPCLEKGEITNLRE